MSYSLIVRYGSMNSVSTFKTEIGDLRLGESVVIRTERGVELGDVVSKPEEIAGEQQAESFAGDVLRRATRADLDRVRDIDTNTVPAEFKFCQQKIAELNLQMKLVAIEHLFSGDKIIFYYVADGRVDFRQLVKDLASEYRTRIEMRQIGVRDEARLLADYEHCGREICCRQFMKSLEPVTMRMAKAQKTTLDPSKISGRCGRLMCCLRFEDEVYDELRGRLPRRGTRVRTARGWGEVLGGDILRQVVMVEFEPGKQVPVKLDEVLERDEKPVEGRRSDREEGEPSREERSGPRGERPDRDRRDGGGRNWRRNRPPSTRPGEGPRGGPPDRDPEGRGLPGDTRPSDSPETKPPEDQPPSEPKPPTRPTEDL